MRFHLTIFTLVICFGALRSFAAQPVTIAIDHSQHFQRIDGFGVNGTWWSQGADHWPKKVLDQALDLLFTSRGAHLTIYRYNIGAGAGSEIDHEIHFPGRRTSTIEVSPGVYDLSRDRVALNVLDQVVQRGIGNIIAISNSPPARLTRTGMVSGGENGGSNLRDGAENQYARYLVDIADLIRRHCKLPRIALSPINEPQWHWGNEKRTQEGCYYSPGQAAAVVEAVLKEVAQRHLPIDIQAPDLGQWGGESQKYVQTLLNHPYIRLHLPILSVHSYFSEPTDRPTLAALVHQLDPNLRIHMTEFCQMRPGSHLGMDAALQLAQTIYEDFTLGNISAWEWWLAVSSSNYADGLLYISPDRQNLLISKRFDVLSQFSRFISPGSVCIAAKCSSPSLKVLAFSAADHSTIVTVIINASESELPISLHLPAGFRVQQIVFTDATHRVAESLQALSLIAPARSVMTVISIRPSI